MWVAGSALAAILLATVLLIAVVMFNGLGVFWPAAIVQLQLDDGTRVIGQWMRTETNPDTGEESIQLKTGNRELDPQRMDFHWYRTETIREMTWPPDVVVVERMENGNFHGLLETVKAPSLAMSAAEGIEEGLAQALVLVRRREAAEVHPLATQLAALSHRLQHVGNTLMKLEYRKKNMLANVNDSDTEPRREIDGRIAELRAEESQIRGASDELVTKKATLEADIRQNVASFRVASGEIHEVALADIVRVYYPNAMHGLGQGRALPVQGVGVAVGRSPRIQHRGRIVSRDLRDRGACLPDGDRLFSLGRAGGHLLGRIRETGCSGSAGANRSAQPRGHPFHRLRHLWAGFLRPRLGRPRSMAGSFRNVSRPGSRRTARGAFSGPA